MEKMKKSTWIGIISYLVLFFLIVFTANLADLNAWFGKLFLLLRPVIIGLTVAYLANPILNFCERRMLAKLPRGKFRRGLAIFLTLLFLFVILSLLIFLIIPQLFESISTFVNNYDEFIENGVSRINEAIRFLNDRFLAQDRFLLEELKVEEVSETLSEFFSSLRLDRESLSEYLLGKNFFKAFNFAGNLILVLAELIIALFITIYFLASKEKRYAQVMRFRKAFFSPAANESITAFTKIAHRSFGGFLTGKIIDSIVIGILSYIVNMIVGIPYNLLISVFIAVTNIVPVIGPIIGAIPTSIIILFTDPSKVIPFLIIVLIVQQFDANLIGPAILGENTGVSALCVFVAVVTMGSLWGMTGMILGVPLFATVLALADRFLERKLKAKGLPTDTKNYYAPVSAAKQNKRQKKREKEKAVAEEIPNDTGLFCMDEFEAFQLETYRLAKKHRIFFDDSDEARERFAKEEAALLKSKSSPTASPPADSE
ncbi:MAG: AI-2E family transporter [Clostridia bacterium]|nr:AI-2E family transporter [Clostridia bacterium]